MNNNEKMIKNATITSVWDDGSEVTTNCKVNLVTREVFDIEVNDSDNIEGLNGLDREYITIDGEEYDVYNSALYDLENNYEDFWYDNKMYPHLSVCEDYKYLLENLSDKALNELERIIDAYTKGKIDIDIIRDENDEIKFEESFSLIVNDKDYEKSGFEDTALKWYEGFEDTGFFVDCFSEIDSNSYCFDVDYIEKGKQKSFQIGIAAKEKPDNLWLAQRISNYFSTRYPGNVETALASVAGIDVKITDFRGEYVDSDEVYGDDLKALFEHVKTERYKLFVDDEVHYAMLTKHEVNRIQKDIAGELNCQFEITDEKGEKIESGIIDFIEKDEKPGLDAVISAAEQRQDNGLDKNTPVVEQER